MHRTKFRGHDFASTCQFPSTDMLFVHSQCHPDVCKTVSAKAQAVALSILHRLFASAIQQLLSATQQFSSAACARLDAAELSNQIMKQFAIGDARQDMDFLMGRHCFTARK